MEQSTRRHIVGRYDEESKTIINSNNPYTPPWGTTLLSFFMQEKGREKNKSGAAHRRALVKRERESA